MAKPSVTGFILRVIGEFILERNHINMVCVAGALLKIHNLEFIWEFMLERNHINVMYVAKPLGKMDILQFIREFILNSVQFRSVQLLTHVRLFLTP